MCFFPKYTKLIIVLIKYGDLHKEVFSYMIDRQSTRRTEEYREKRETNATEMLSDESLAAARTTL